MSGRGSYSELFTVFFVRRFSKRIYIPLPNDEVSLCEAAPVAVLDILCIQPLALRTSPLLHYYYYLLQARHHLLVKLLSSHNYELTPTELKSIAKYRLIACNNNVSASFLKRN